MEVLLLTGLLDGPSAPDLDDSADGWEAGLLGVAVADGVLADLDAAVAGVGQGKKGEDSGTAKRATSCKEGWLPLTCNT